MFKNGKMIIIIINFYNSSGKPRKFSRSRMTKRIVLLNSSREIWLPHRISRQSKFHVFRGIGFRVTHGMTCGALV